MTRFTQLKHILQLAAVACTLIIVSASCSTKRNNAATRHYQAFITRYNIYFNGDEHYKQTLKELESSYQDDYSRRLYLHPIEAKTDAKAPQPEGNFDRSIEKAQKAIQLRSIKKKPARQPGKQYDENYKEWMRRFEYNPFLHNAWMMMAKSQYFNGDFSNAAGTFQYIARHFRWLPNTVTEAKLWQARSYLAENWLYEAEGIILRIKPAELTDNTLKGLYYFDYADLLLRQERNDEAVTKLRELLKYSKGKQKMRVNFLLGQVLSELGRKQEAYKAFADAGGSGSADYRTKFNARIRQSEVFEGANINSEIKSLNAMTRYDRNKEFLDQIYYAIGNLYMSRNDTVKAIPAYQKAVSKSTRNGYDKALASLALGKIYFTQHRYDLAQPAYSEAIPQLPSNFPDLTQIKRRSDVLDELAVYAQNVHLQDSLLTIAAMSPEEQMAVCQRLAKEAKKKRENEEARQKREELKEQQAANAPALPNSNIVKPIDFNQDQSWYFYNPTAVASGKQAFQQTWGSRKLEDNWRRRNRNEFDFNDFGPQGADSQENDNQEGNIDNSAEQQKKNLQASNDPESPEYYWKNIPTTDVEKVTANDIVQEGLYNMGLILKDKLEDLSAAEDEFNTLLKRYPHNVYRLDVYYNLYLLYVRQGDMAKAEKYRKLITEEFADSRLGQAMQNPDYLQLLRQMDEHQEVLYDETFKAYMANNNKQVRANYEEMKRDYPLSKIMPKFMFLNALTFVTEDKPKEFASSLRELLEKYPDTDLTPIASSYLKGLAQGRKLQKGDSNMRAMVWDTRLLTPGDSTATPIDEPLKVTLDPNAPQMLALTYDMSEVDSRLLVYEVARHNFSTFVTRDFDLEQMNFGKLGVLLIKGFRNDRELNHYRKLLTANFKMPEGVRVIPISEQNFEMLLKQGRSFEEYLQAIGEKVDTKTHEAVLPPSEYPSAKEMYPDSPDVEPAPQGKEADKPSQKPAKTVKASKPELTAKPKATNQRDNTAKGAKDVKNDTPAQSAQPAKHVKAEAPAQIVKPAKKDTAPVPPSINDIPEGSEE